MNNLLIWTLFCSIARCMMGSQMDFAQSLTEPQLQKGNTVEIIGLTKQEDLNGSEGVLLYQVTDSNGSERWAVELKEGKTPIQVKPKNLILKQSLKKLLAFDFFFLFVMYWFLSPLLFLLTVARQGTKYVQPPFIKFMAKTFKLQSMGKKVLSQIFHALTMFLFTSISSGWYTAVLLVVVVYVIQAAVAIVAKIMDKNGISEGWQMSFTNSMNMLSMFIVPWLLSFLELQHFLLAYPELESSFKSLPMPGVWYYPRYQDCADAYAKWHGSENMLNSPFCDKTLAPFAKPWFQLF